MEATPNYTKYSITTTLLFLSFFTLTISNCDARKLVIQRKTSHLTDENIKHSKILEMAMNLNMLLDVSKKDSTNVASFITSPITLPPFNSLSPTSLPDNNYSPQYCVYPPPDPQSPSTASPSPIDYNPTPFSSPPSSPFTNPGPPQYAPSPPSGYNTPSPSGGDITPSPPSGDNVPTPSSGDITPSPPSGYTIPSPSSGDITPSPPSGYTIPSPTSGDITPSPPSGDNIPSPPEFVPSPLSFEPSPPVFEPPVVYPPPKTPSTPPRSSGGGGRGVWCVAKPSVPDPIIQEAMNYACGSGADCGPIQPNGPCYQPDTILAHASYAFNSYWQRTKVAGGTCSFGGTAILVTVDPSSGSCEFVTV